MSPDWPLETERLMLRPFVESDFDAMHAMRSSAEAVRYLYEEPFSPEQTCRTAEAQDGGSAWTKEGDGLSFAVVERASGITVGDVERSTG